MQNKFCAAAAGVVLATTLSLVADGALAQSTSDADPGKPLSLLQFLTHHGPSKRQAKTADKAAAKGPGHVAARGQAATTAREKPIRIASKGTARHIHFAERRKEPGRWNEHEAATAAAAEPSPQTAWPTLAPPTNEAAPPVNTAAAPPANAATAAEPPPSELEVGGQTVQIASPDQVNELDLAADQPANQPADDRLAATAPADAAAMPDASVAARNNTANDDPDATAEDDSADDTADAPTANNHVVAFAQEADGAANHPSWLAEGLATLGGALAAGSVAWFLIGSAPFRRYS